MILLEIPNGNWRPPSNVVVVMMFKILNTQSVNALCDLSGRRWSVKPKQDVKV